jgi:3-deoxy-D-manno-octulosonic-acid transferase
MQTANRETKPFGSTLFPWGKCSPPFPLVKSLKKRFPEEEVAFTVTTRQGMEIAQRELKNDGLASPAYAA